MRNQGLGSWLVRRLEKSGPRTAVIHGELSRRRDAGQRVRLVGANDLVRRVWGLCGFDQELLAG